MPAYDYDCAACGRRFEVIHGVHADPPTSCPLCGKGPIRKAISAAAVHYKGSGWAKKERRASASSTSKASTDTTTSDTGSSTDTGSTSKRGSSTDAGASSETRTTAPAKAADAGASGTTD
jgi:putative FmdB family regulatory protein